ncbi:adenylate/guanylate cyclase domain-containing protein [Desulfococcaceae bacterium HSG9]|nr:adenylate/guanylate cyclase domain-containing protein [Desulfococcaceae bacterium HSG9]
MNADFNLTKHHITVLLVDDQFLIGEVVRRMLAKEKDISFHYCQNPDKAIETACQVSPTVILQDLHMPSQEVGLALLHQFKTDPATLDVPLIILSTNETPLIKAETFSKGANDYIVKLPDRLEVIARIRYHSGAYINRLERNEAYSALLKSQNKLEVRNRFIREAFGRYISDEIVEEVLETPGGLRLGGEKRIVTILMADLRGFTSLSEAMSAEDVVDMLNIFLETMTEVILEHYGTINTFIGDAIMVVFGAPQKRNDDAMRAVTCALVMQKKMSDVNKQCLKKGYPQLKMGIGINTGEVVAGNIGSHKRLKYDFIGHNVNIAARIEAYSIGGQILISKKTLQACKQKLIIASQMQVVAKGIKKPILIYDIIGVNGDDGLSLVSNEKLFLMQMDKPFPVHLTIIDNENRAGSIVLQGTVLKLGPAATEIKASRNCRLLTNLSFSLIDTDKKMLTSEAYGKVTEIISKTPPVFRINFTFIPNEIELFFEKILKKRAESSI